MKKGRPKIVYVLLDGIGDLPHPSLNNLTPLEAAYTPNLDSLARRGVMGRVISVAKGIAPQSDIAVFNMLGYSFSDGSYVGRGVIESIGCNMDFRDGDLALRGNFAAVDDTRKIIDRRAGRSITPEESKEVCKTLRDQVKFSDHGVSFELEPTIAHRVVIRFRHNKISLSDKISNTDPAYEKVDGMGVAKESRGDMYVQSAQPQDASKEAALSAMLLNEFTGRIMGILRDHPVNAKRIAEGKKPMNCILARDSGNRLPNVERINKKYNLRFGCIVDMPVEVGIAKVLGMKMFKGGDIDDYEEKANVASKSLLDLDVIYVHLKGPDEYGHDGDPRGKKRNIEEIDKRFFGSLVSLLKADSPTVVVCGDHSTPCVKRAHSDDPIPLLISGPSIQRDRSARYTEKYAKIGSMGLLRGMSVLSAAIEIAS